MEGPVGSGRGRTEGRLFTRNFVFATLANFSNALGMQMLVATLPVYVVSMGGSRFDAGAVSGALALVALAFRPLAGWITDSWSRRPVVLTGTSCYGIASIIYLFSGSIAHLLLGRFVHGFGLSCYTTASNAFIADIAPLKRLAESIGLFSAAQALGLVIGPAVGFMIIEWSGFQALFYFTGGLAFTAFAILTFTRERRRMGDAQRRPWSLRTGIVRGKHCLLPGWRSVWGRGLGQSRHSSRYSHSRGESGIPVCISCLWPLHCWSPGLLPGALPIVTAGPPPSYREWRSWLQR